MRAAPAKPERLRIPYQRRLAPRL